MPVKLPALAVVVVLLAPVLDAERKPVGAPERKVVLWRQGAIASRDLVYGAGGRAHRPQGPFRFQKEDLKASSPKFDVVDAAGVKWKVKLGQEARSETAASRLVWAAGFYTAEDYYLPEMQVSGVPRKVHRGRKFIDPDGTMHGARLKREPDGAEKVGLWKWKHNPFVGSREFNGLRTMMALLNNWDVKDENNAVYRDGGELVYQVSDLGATFASPGFAFPLSEAKDNLAQYRRARFVCGVGVHGVDFCSPGRSALMRMVAMRQFVYRWRLRWIGRDIPLEDARWMGEQLSRLSGRQIRDAFRASGYGPEEVEGFAQVVERRIGALTDLPR